MKKEGKSQREIAEELGVSQQAVSKNTTLDSCPKLSNPEPSNVIPSPVRFQKQEPVDDYPMLGFDRFLRGSFPHLSNLDR